MPPGYHMSSPNNANLAAARRRIKGSPTTDHHASHIPGIPPISPLTASPTWAGHTWSAWQPIPAAIADLPSTASAPTSRKPSTPPIPTLNTSPPLPLSTPPMSSTPPRSLTTASNSKPTTSAPTSSQQHTSPANSSANPHAPFWRHSATTHRCQNSTNSNCGRNAHLRSLRDLCLENACKYLTLPVDCGSFSS